LNEEAGESANKRGGGKVGTNTGMEDQPPGGEDDEWAKMRGVGKNETPKEEMKDENWEAGARSRLRRMMRARRQDREAGSARNEGGVSEEMSEEKKIGSAEDRALRKVWSRTLDGEEEEHAQED
jgi:hypothetical protein